MPQQSPTPSEAPGLFTGDASSMSSYYDRVLVPGMFAPWAQDLVARLPLRADDHVLDVCCGTGALAEALVTRLTDGGVLGTDLAPAMLAVAERKDIPRAMFRVGDAVAQPVEDGEFDGVTCQQGLQFVPDRAGAVSEMRRVLRPGGWLAVACWTAIGDQVAMGAFSTALINRGWAAAAAAIAVPFSLGDAAELGALAAASGFIDIRVETVTRDIVLPPPGEFADGYAQVPPFAAPYQAATQQERDAFVADVVEVLAPYTDGTLTTSPMTSHILFATAG
ncbi:MAG: hypothetical protein QOG52_1046 [Frankiaceae bacterium]|jgi:ubiquinone/menaquinone biosynthesis C-methylase UbiE|nr:hypothetical protein [Frankiaceae bacterium]